MSPSKSAEYLQIMQHESRFSVSKLDTRELNQDVSGQIVTNI